METTFETVCRRDSAADKAPPVGEGSSRSLTAVIPLRLAAGIGGDQVLRALWLLSGLWCIALFIQKGHPCDETEHAHIAWLMGRLGQRPLEDFFQHHMPLLWDVLKVYFLVGFDGPEVLYFGRFLVVASMLTLVFGWLTLGRLLARDAENGTCGAAVGVCSFIAFFLMATDVVVIRPETLAAAPWILACLCWSAANTRASSGGHPAAALYFLSGVFFCAAACFSVRIVVLAGWFFFLSERKLSWKDLTSWLLGGAVFLASYLVVCGVSLRYLFFATSYSALLQKIGTWDAASYFADVHYVKIFIVQTVLWGLVLKVSAPESRRASRLHLAYFFFTVALGLITSWPHAYLQNFMTGYLSLAGSLVVLGSRVSWRCHPRALRVLVLALALLVAAVLMKLWNDAYSEATVFDDLKHRRTTLDQMDSSDTVLLSYPCHPIAARDASYYGPWLVDSPNRMREAVSHVRERYGLPDCDYLTALKTMSPRLIDYNLGLAVPPPEVPELRQTICASYDLIRWSRGYYPVVLFQRREPAERYRRKP